MKKLEKVTLKSSALSGSVEVVESRVCNSGMDIYFHIRISYGPKNVLERGGEN